MHFFCIFPIQVIIIKNSFIIIQYRVPTKDETSGDDIVRNMFSPFSCIQGSLQDFFGPFSSIQGSLQICLVRFLAFRVPCRIFWSVFQYLAFLLDLFSQFSCIQGSLQVCLVRFLVFRVLVDLFNPFSCIQGSLWICLVRFFVFRVPCRFVQSVFLYSGFLVGFVQSVFLYSGFLVDLFSPFSCIQGSLQICLVRFLVFRVPCRHKLAFFSI